MTVQSQTIHLDEPEQFVMTHPPIAKGASK